MAKEMTMEEVRSKVIQTVWNDIDYWDRLDGAKGQRERLAGLAFSILAMLDGCVAGIPGFLVTPNPHPLDAEYCVRRGVDWYPNHVDIAGSLHEIFHVFDPKRRPGAKEV